MIGEADHKEASGLDMEALGGQDTHGHTHLSEIYYNAEYLTVIRPMRHIWRH